MSTRRARLGERSITLVATIVIACQPPKGTGQAALPPPASQNPSPMVERTRRHDRIPQRDVSAERIEVAGVLPRPIELIASVHARRDSTAPLVVHFLGASYIVAEAASRLATPALVAVINIAPGTSAYERPFLTPDGWPRVLGAIDSVIAGSSRRPVFLTAFSAGTGAVRAILAHERYARAVRGVLILDGVHTGYLPERRVLADGGALDTTKVASLIGYARRATAGEVRMIVTHSEVFPGTFASTTETSNLMLDLLGIERTPLLEWGPVGMQQTSLATRGRFTVLGYAGNSAPDHLDHLHALPVLLSRLVQ
jgi:hypothetical protein